MVGEIKLQRLNKECESLSELLSTKRKAGKEVFIAELKLKSLLADMRVLASSPDENTFKRVVKKIEILKKELA